MANKRKFKIVKNNGQIIIGDGNCQLTLNGVSGGVVNILAPQQKPKITERSFPIASLPKPFNRLIGRGPEKQQALENLRFEQSVEFYGEEGIGKSVLVKALFPQIQLTSLFSDKIVYISSKNKKLSEIKQFLFDCFYETNLNYRVTDFEFANRFKDKKALIILDDIQVSRHDLEDLMNAAPLCTFLITTRQRNIWVDGISQFISGLSASESLQLIAKEIGRALTDSELAPAKFISETFRGNPLKILQRVARAKTENVPLAHLAAELELSLEAPLEHAAQKDGRGYRLILGLLAAFSSLAASARTLAEASGETIQTVNQTLEELRLLHLVEFEENRYRLAENFSEYLAETWPLNTYRERLLQFYLEWVQQYASRGDVLLEELEAITSVVNWAAEGGYYAEAIALGQAVEPVVALEGLWGVWESLLDNILNSAIYGQDISTESWALHQLGTRALCLGENPSAISFLTRALELRQLEGNAAAIEVTQHNLNLLIGGGGSDSGEPEPEEQWTGDPQSSSTSEQPSRTPSSPPPTSLPNPSKALSSSKVATVTTLLLVGMGTGIGVGANLSNSESKSLLPDASTENPTDIQPAQPSNNPPSQPSSPEISSNVPTPRFTPPNPAPSNSLVIARDVEYTVKKGEEIIIYPLNNDSSPDSSAFIKGHTKTMHGSLNAVGPETFSYKANDTFTGTDEFSYTISDDNLEDTATVRIIIFEGDNVGNPENKTKVEANDRFYTVNQGESIVIYPLKNDRSPGNSAFIDGHTETQEGFLQAISEDSFSYTPRKDFTGPDKFEYSISDSNSEDNATVYITVIPSDSSEQSSKGLVEDKKATHTPEPEPPVINPPASEPIADPPPPKAPRLIARDYSERIVFQQDGNSCGARNISFAIDTAEESDKNFSIVGVGQPNLGTAERYGEKNLSYTVTLDEIRERRSASGQSRQVQVVVFTRVTSPPQGDLALLAPSGESPAVNEPTIDDFSETVQFNYVISNGETQDKGTITVEVFAPADCFSTSSSLN